MGGELVDKYGRDWSPLHKAVRVGDAEEVKVLLAAGADVNTYLRLPLLGTGFGGGTALHADVFFNGDTAISKILLEHGADLEQRDVYRKTALLAAISRGSLEHAKLFLEHGADVNAINATEALPPGFASWEKASQRDEAPSVDDAESRQMSYSEGGTALHNVFFYIHNAAKVNAFVRLLLEHGADINARCLSGETVLGKAVRLATVRGVGTGIVKLFLERGADASVADYHGNTVAAWAEDDPKIAELLAKHAAAGGDA